MGENLAAKQLGGVDQANQWFLHTSGTAVASGAQVADGGGNDTGLVVGPNWIGVAGSGGFEAKLTFTGAANRTLDLPDGGTGLVANNGEGVTKADFLAALGITQKVVTSDVTNATTSPVAVSDLDFTPAASGVYWFEFLLRIQTTGIATDVNIDLTGPAEATEVVGGMAFHRGAAISTSAQEQMAFNAFPTALDGATLAAADTGQLLQLTGLLVMSGSAATSPLAVKLRAGNTSNTAKVMAGSALRIEKLN